MPDVKYSIDVTPAARRELSKLAAGAQRQIATKIRALAHDPRPSGVKKLEAAEPPLYRVRAGDYRIVFAIDDDKRQVTIVLVGDRKDVYRRGL